MKFEFNKRYNTIALYILAVALFGVVCVTLFLNIPYVSSVVRGFFGVIKPIIYALVIAFMLHPAAESFERNVFRFKSKKSDFKGLRRILSLVAVYLLLALFLTVIILILIPQAIDGYEDFSVKIPDYITKAYKTLDSFVSENEIFNEYYDEIMKGFQSIIDNVTGYVNGAVPYVYGFFKGFVTEVWNLILGLVISVYMLSSRETLFAQAKKLLRAFLSDGAYKKTIEFSTFSGRTLVGYMDGKFFDTVVVGIVTFALLTIFSFPYAQLISLIICVMSFVPYVGIFLGALPGAVIILISSPEKFFGFAVMILVVGLADIYLLIPKILGKQVGIPSMWIIISLLLMGGLFGLVGLFIGIPFAAVIYNLARRSINRSLADKSLPTSIEAYTADNFSAEDSSSKNNVNPD